MTLPLTPRLHHAGFLRSILAHIYSAGMQPEDYLVLARRSDLAASRTTELLKARSVAAEELSIAQNRLDEVKRHRERDDADLRIFASDTPRPEPRKLFGFFTAHTPESRDFEKRHAGLEAALALSTKRYKEAQAAVRAQRKALEELTSRHAKQEAERDSLRDSAIRAGTFLMLHYQAASDITEAMRTFDDVRTRSRGDRRLYIARVFAEALIESPAAAFAMVRDTPEAFGGESSTEAALAQALVHFAGGGKLTPRDLPPTAPENYAAQDTFAVHAFLASATGLPIGGSADEQFEPLLALAHGWYSGDFPGEAWGAPAQWHTELPRTELLCAAHLRHDQPDEVLQAMAFNAGETAEALSRHRRGKELARSAFARIADTRIRVGPLYAQACERCICLFLLALREVASVDLYALAREELTVSDCGNIYELLRAVEADRKPRFRRAPDDFYWEELTDE
jgi:hypothetical protein